MERTYRILLRLYPRDYQVEFAEEMVAVFQRRAIERRSEGRFAYLQFLVHECSGVLCNAVQQQSPLLRVTPPVGGAALAAVLHIALYTGAVAVLHKISGEVQNAAGANEDPGAAVFAVAVVAVTTLLCLVPLLLLLSMRLLRRHR